MNNLLVTIVITIIASGWFFTYDELYENTEIVVSTIAIVTGFIIVGLSYRLSIRHSKTQFIGKSFIYLMLAFICYSFAETIWLQTWMGDIETYPSFAEFFYMGYYIFLILFIHIVFRNFICDYSLKYGLIVLLSVSQIAVSLTLLGPCRQKYMPQGTPPRTKYFSVSSNTPNSRSFCSQSFS